MTALFKIKSLILLLTLTSLTAFSQVSMDGLVAYYPFNGNANDESGNGNHGTANGATLTSDRFGMTDSAYSFDGSTSFIEVADASSIKNLSEITISAWVNVNAWYASSGSNYFPILHKSDQNQHGEFALILRDTGGISHLGTEENGFAFSNWNLSQWHHVVTIFSNNNNKVYVDGVLVYDEPTGVFPNPISADLPLIIGKDLPGLVEYANGKIDDIGIWNRALTEGEVDDLFDEGICYQTVTVTDTLIIDVTTLSYDPITYLNRFTVFPNPTNDMITIDNGDYNNVNGYAVEIKNSLAQSMFYSVVDQQQFTIDISSWDTGMYFVHIYNGSGHLIEVRKIILQ